MSKWYRDLFGFGENIMFAPDDGTGGGGAGTGDGAGDGKDTGGGGDKGDGGDNGKGDGKGAGTETPKVNFGDAFKDKGFMDGLKSAFSEVLAGAGLGKKDDPGKGSESKPGNAGDGDGKPGDDGSKHPEVDPEQIKADALKEFQKEQERIGSVRNDAKAKALEFNWTAKGLLTIDKYCPTASKEDAVKFVEEINSMVNEQAEARFKNGGKPGNSGSGDGKPADPDPKDQGKKDFEARHGKK